MTTWAAGDAYEAYMGRWSRPLARAFVEWLRPAPGGRWLDVGCGTGALSAAVCALARPASVIGCDPSAPFVAHARRALGEPAVLMVAGADDLPRQDDGFDAVVSALVLNFLPDPPGALAAMRERLRRGGVVAATVWDYAEGMEPLRFFWDEAVALDPGAAAHDEGRRFPICRPEPLEAAFLRSGLTGVQTGSLTIDIELAGFDDYWGPFLQRTGPAPSYVASLDPPRQEALRARLLRRLGDAPRRLQARAWAARGG